MRKEKVFQLIGKLTVQFATMEHKLQGLLETLIGDGDSIVGPLFIHNLALAGLLKKIELLANYRIKNDSRLILDLNRTIKKINALREERNLLIHGEWKIEASDSLRVTVRDFKIKFDQEQWHGFSETEFNEKKLTLLTRRLDGLGGEVDYLARRIGEISAA